MAVEQAIAAVRRLRLAIVEDDDLYRDMLRIALGRHPKLEVLGAFAESGSAQSAIARLRPDAVLLDVDLGGGLDGISLGRALRRELPGLAVILLTNQVLPQILSFLPEEEVGGWSYLHKRTVRDMESLVRAIEAAAAQLVVIDGALLAGRQPRSNSPLERLSPRQRQVLELMVQGCSNAAIAQKLVIAPKSVERHINQLYRELGIQAGEAGDRHPRVQAVLAYLRESQSRPA